MTDKHIAFLLFFFFILLIISRQLRPRSLKIFNLGTAGFKLSRDLLTTPTLTADGQRRRAGSSTPTVQRRPPLRTPTTTTQCRCPGCTTTPASRRTATRRFAVMPGLDMRQTRLVVRRGSGRTVAVSAGWRRRVIRIGRVCQVRT
jgi:hypothetical protein